MNSLRTIPLVWLTSCLILGCEGVTPLEGSSGSSSLSTSRLAQHSLPVLFSPFDAPLVIDIEIGPDEQLALEAEPDKYVPATFAGAGDSAAIEIGLRFKGRYGSFRGCPFSCEDKTALKIDFNRIVPGQDWRGLESLALNNQVQDPSLIREWLGYELFRRQGVPAPRTGYVELRVNGESWGLYLMLEDRDEPFLDSHFASTHALYEGEYGQDLIVGTTEGFDIDEGPKDGAAIAAFATAIEQAPTGGAYAALAPIVDWNEVLAAMAVELFIGHWDGYAATRNNYHLHVDDAGVWRLLPWGLDQTFYDYRPLYAGRGILLQRCLEDDACLVAWSQKLLAVAADAKAMGYREKSVQLADLLQPYHSADPRRETHARHLVTLAHETSDFLDDRIVEVESAVSCQLDPASDKDGDGKVCSFDCNESDPTTYVGASEVCLGGVADGVDNDCDGLVDEDASCPACVTDGEYSYCRTSVAFAAAEATCAELGSMLVVLNDSTEATQVNQGVAAHLGKVRYWIGLSDRVTEGQFTWSDGTLLDRDAPGAFAKFARGEPNNANSGEHCVHASEDSGMWNDFPCDGKRTFVCERNMSLPAPVPARGNGKL